jgi:iron complex outermembrane receptor protein
MNKLLFALIILLLMLMLFNAPSDSKGIFAADDISSDSSPSQTDFDLTALSIEQLMNIDITSVTKWQQRLSRSASAIFVITGEDIRRSGATSIPEILRIVPGLQVARVDSNKWAITSRGFNKLFSNKLLVLIDGRTVYTSLFSGVYWDVQDTLLEDVERIEVIRGPGATVWGTNAVNGVINIITKKAEDAQGILISVLSGNEEKGIVGLRYGGKKGEDVHYRLYAKYFNRDDFVFPSGDRADDEWDFLRGGFRIDWDVSDKNQLTMQGDIYNGDSGQSLTLSENSFVTIRDTIETAGGNMLARWKHTFSDISDMTMQLYYDRTERDEDILEQYHDTIDFDFLSRFGLGERQRITWGLDYRFIGDHIDTKKTAITVNNEIRSSHFFSVFVQDEITIVPDRLTMTFGSKLVHNSYSGFEHQPSGRLVWTPHEHHTVWAAVSRAVRTPSRFENDGNVNFIIPVTSGLTISNSLSGDSDYKSENLLAYEIGYRALLLKNLSFDISVFYNVYDDLATNELISSSFVFGFPSKISNSLKLDNKMDGETYGLEIATKYQVTDWWRVSVGYSYLQIELHKDSSSNDSTAEIPERESPHHQFQMRSFINLPYNLEFDTAVYYVENLSQGDVSGYIRLDARLGWHLNENLDVSIGLQNLLDPEHQEFHSSSGVEATEIERSIFGKIVWRH